MEYADENYGKGSRYSGDNDEIEMAMMSHVEISMNKISAGMLPKFKCVKSKLDKCMG